MLREVTITSEELKRHGIEIVTAYLEYKPLEILVPIDDEWRNVGPTDSFSPSQKYRIKEEQHFVNWGLLHKELKYFIIDSSGAVLLGKEKPNKRDPYLEVLSLGYIQDTLNSVLANPPRLYELNPNVGWADSLTKRPE